MDRKLFAASEKWEVKYLIKKYPLIPATVIIQIAMKAGRSRLKIYQSLAEWLYKNNAAK